MSESTSRWLLGFTVVGLGVGAFVLVGSSSSSTDSPDEGISTGRRSAPVPVVTKREKPRPSPRPNVNFVREEGESTELALDRCQSELTDIRIELDKYLPAHIRFEQSSESPELKESLEPKILSVFDADQPAHDLECRGRVCRLELAWNQGADRGTWQRKIQSSTIQNEVCGMGFHSGRPTTDAITGDPLTTQEVWLTMCDEETLSGQPVAKAFLQEFVESGNIEACKDAHPDRGTWSIRIGIQNGVIEIFDGGDLSATETGKCLGAAMRDMAKTVDLPENIRGSFLYHDMDV